MGLLPPGETRAGGEVPDRRHEAAASRRNGSRAPRRRVRPPRRLQPRPGDVPPRAPARAGVEGRGEAAVEDQRSREAADRAAPMKRSLAVLTLALAAVSCRTVRP